MKLMVAATVTLCGYSSGSEQVLKRMFRLRLPTPLSLLTSQGSQNRVFDSVTP